MHSLKSKIVSNLEFIFIEACYPSVVRNILWATIWYEYHDVCNFITYISDIKIHNVRLAAVIDVVPDAVVVASDRGPGRTAGSQARIRPY
mgnify:CR=1 FL=1